MWRNCYGKEMRFQVEYVVPVILCLDTGEGGLPRRSRPIRGAKVTVAKACIQLCFTGMGSVQIVSLRPCVRLFALSGSAVQIIVSPKDDNRPVLKHGPRSLTCVRVCEIQSSTRNESDIFLSACTCRRYQPRSSEMGLSMSTCARTRKMVNYA